MNNIPDELLELVKSAIESFNRNERYLIVNDLSERCICSKFGFYLQEKLKTSIHYNEYVVDVEYNRGSECIDQYKKLLDGKKIVVDLIVHKREHDDLTGYDNLICCEMKKSTDGRGYVDDEERLKKLTSYSYSFLYRLGVMLEVDMEESILKIHSYFKLG